MRILLYTDLTILPDELFWHRDLGLLNKTFRDLGHDASLVVHPASESPSKIKNPKTKISKEPVIWASPSEVRSPAWWKSHTPDLIILGLWTRPKYDPIRRAALSATPRIIERADSDGMRTASCGVLTYARRRYHYFRDRTGLWPDGFSIPVSALYSAASILATPWIEARLAKTLRLIPSLAVETPSATQFWKKLAVRLGADSARVQCIPHPIQTDIFRPDPAVPKTNQVISVGRWESHQKNLPLLLKTLVAFLRSSPAWTALVVGSGLPVSSPHPRIRFSPALPAHELARHMQSSKIFLSSSRFESFGLSAAEATRCGCRVVAPRLCALATTAYRPALGRDLLSALCRARDESWHSTAPLTSPDWSPSAVARQFLGAAGA